MKIAARIDPERQRYYTRQGWWGARTLLDHWNETVQQYGNRRYVCGDNGVWLTYRQIDDYAGRLAAYLRENGVECGDVAAIQLPNWSAYCVAYVAGLKAGAVLHLISRNTEKSELADLLTRSGAKALICPTSFRGLDYEAMLSNFRKDIPSLRCVVLVDELEPARSGHTTLTQVLKTCRPLDTSPEVDPNDVAALLNTSGTTGSPKIVMITHNNILFSETQFNRELGVTRDDIMFMPAPLHHATGFHHGLIAPMLAGAGVVLQQRFQREQAVFATVYGAVLSALDRDHTRPQASIPGVRPTDTVTPNQTSLPLHDGGGRVNGTQFMPASRFRPAGAMAPGKQPDYPAAPARLEGKPPAAEQKKSPFRWVEPLPEKEPPQAPETPAGTEPPAPLRQDEGPEPAPQPVRTQKPKAAPAKEEPPISAPEERPEPAPAPVEEKNAEPAPAPEQPAPPEELVSQAQTPWIIRGELFHTYILVEQGDKALLIDKHAAHERANFDRLKAADYRPMVQELLTPVTFSLPPEERQLLLEQSELLARFGFEVEEFGSNALAVRAAPDYLETGDIEPALGELARHLRLTGTADPAAARDELLHTMACKAAIKGGWRTGEAELEETARLVMSGAVKYCPHGRPVAIELTQKQLEKQFKRA